MRGGRAPGEAVAAWVGVAVGVGSGVGVASVTGVGAPTKSISPSATVWQERQSPGKSSWL